MRRIHRIAQNMRAIERWTPDKEEVLDGKWIVYRGFDMYGSACVMRVSRARTVRSDPNIRGNRDLRSLNHDRQVGMDMFNQRCITSQTDFQSGVRSTTALCRRRRKRDSLLSPGRDRLHDRISSPNCQQDDDGNRDFLKLAKAKLTSARLVALRII